MIDLRREQNHVFKEMDRYQNKIGEGIVWFKFDTESSYDRVYNEGGKHYLPGIAVPVLWVDQIEDNETYSDVGRRPTQRLRTAVSARTMNEVGIGAEEAHGGRMWDTKPDGKPWWDDRLNDILYYDGRFYEVSSFQIRGRMRADSVIGVSAIETQLEDDRIWDLFPGTPITP